MSQKKRPIRKFVSFRVGELEVGDFFVVYDTRGSLPKIFQVKTKKKAIGDTVGVIDNEGNMKYLPKHQYVWIPKNEGTKC